MNNVAVHILRDPQDKHAGRSVRGVQKGSIFRATANSHSASQLDPKLGSKAPLLSPSYYSSLPFVPTDPTRPSTPAPTPSSNRTLHQHDQAFSVAPFPSSTLPSLDSPPQKYGQLGDSFYESGDSSTKRRYGQVTAKGPPPNTLWRSVSPPTPSVYSTEYDRGPRENMAVALDKSSHAAEHESEPVSPLVPPIHSDTDTILHDTFGRHRKSENESEVALLRLTLLYTDPKSDYYFTGDQVYNRYVVRQTRTRRYFTCWKTEINHSNNPNSPLFKIEHDNIISLLEVFVYNDILYCLSRKGTYCSLEETKSSIVPPNEEGEFAEICRAVLGALDFIHCELHTRYGSITANDVYLCLGTGGVVKLGNITKCMFRPDPNVSEDIKEVGKLLTEIPANKTTYFWSADASDFVWQTGQPGCTTRHLLESSFVQKAVPDEQLTIYVERVLANNDCHQSPMAP